MGDPHGPFGRPGARMHHVGDTRSKKRPKILNFASKNPNWQHCFWKLSGKKRHVSTIANQIRSSPIQTSFFINGWVHSGNKLTHHYDYHYHGLHTEISDGAMSFTAISSMYSNLEKICLLCERTARQLAQVRAIACNSSDGMLKLFISRFITSLKRSSGRPVDRLPKHCRDLLVNDHLLASACDAPGEGDACSYVRCKAP